MESIFRQCANGPEPVPAQSGKLLRVQHHDELPGMFHPVEAYYLFDGRCVAALSARELADRRGRVILEAPVAAGWHRLYVVATYRLRGGISLRVRSHYSIDHQRRQLLRVVVDHRREVRLEASVGVHFEDSSTMPVSSPWLPDGPWERLGL